MTLCVEEKRWPPIYDRSDLELTIKKLAISEKKSDLFYMPCPQNDIFQGDIISFPNEFFFPFIDENGELSAQEDIEYWVVFGNTCDIARDISTLPYTNISPLEKLPSDAPKEILKSMSNYQNYKTFYFPQFVDDGHYYIDFTKLCTISKANFDSAIKIRELRYSSWILFHSCIVRYLARDDGRND